MEILFLKTLLNSISRFDLLSSSNNMKVEMVRRYYQNIDKMLKLLKPVLEGVVEGDLNEQRSKVLEELDAFVNEARELIESWHHMTSKIYFVMHIEGALTKIHTLALDVCELLKTLPSSAVDESTSECIEQCVQKIQHMHCEWVSSIIKESIIDQREKRIPRPEQLEKVSDSLSLSTNQELLMEVVALDKLKSKISHVEKHGEVEQIDHMIALVTHMHECFVRVKQVHSINGVPIPPDFCCPLSLELMSDPVIVASGQTYERAFIKKWLDQGLTVCPKTRQTLVHTNLIPNYTVKALIANWCESNDIKLPDPIKSVNLNLPTAFINYADPHDNDSNNNHSAHSPRSSPSPDPDVAKLSSHKDAISSNGSLQETYQPEKPLAHHTLSTGSILPTTNGFEKDISRMSLNSSDGSQQSNSEVRHVDSGGQYSSPSRDSASPDDDRFQGHNRSVSASGAVATNDSLPPGGDADLVSRVSSDLTQYSSDNSGEVVREAPASTAPLRESAFPLRLSESRSRSQTIWRRPSEKFSPRIISSPSMDSRPDLSGIETQVRKFIEDLKSDSVDLQRTATAEIRQLAKHNMENRIVIANCGAIPLLVGLLQSTDQKIQENAVTALLNLSINDNNKTAIANAEAIDPLIHVLETGNAEAKENSAATLFSLSVIEENKVKIGRSGAIRPLVELLGSGTPRGKKDAATALFNLSIFHENKTRIVQAGAVRHLVELMDPAAGMVDKAVAVLANLATIPEGRTAIGHEGGIPVLVEVVELGSARGKENAAAALLQLCTTSNRFCSQVLQEGAVPPLVALSQSGTPRAKEKAQSLLTYFRSQRHGNAGRG
ncbi:Zinc finger RING/FYVE/PHD-type protein [Dioscorea alata]|uniref:Zinc finger RING/FYVE/PHD-type protein n=1 Tax=Dioscorea alata TaxID=55571 RepID=A0ACB7UDZ9_DIOAL|nr:Zinc finger RING/FYVE/PHD-type protein [Dioscorea alata]